ncbi:MAG: hypothetical protein OJF51_002777 [Nitrospira sp.]|nr:MAG: hypothetical protein OJF51_002777 [Nitrospira sp.]
MKHGFEEEVVNGVHKNPFFNLLEYESRPGNLVKRGNLEKLLRSTRFVPDRANRLFWIMISSLAQTLEFRLYSNVLCQLS